MSSNKYHKGQYTKGYKGGFMETSNQVMDITWSEQDEIIHKACEGCSSYGVKYFRPIPNTKDFKWIYCTPLEETECPCSICLVKMICRDSCQLYDKYRSHDEIFHRA